MLYRAVLWHFNSTSLPLCTRGAEKGDSRKSPPLSEFSSRRANTALSNLGILGGVGAAGVPAPAGPRSLQSSLPQDFCASRPWPLFALGVVDKSPRPRKG